MAKDGWEKLELAAKSLGLVAIPVVVAVTGHYLNSSLESRESRLAEVLKERELSVTQAIHDQEMEVLRAQRDQEMSVRYVEMAIGILTEAPDEDASASPDPLREWAIRVVSEESPFPIDEGVKQKMRYGPLPDSVRTNQYMDPGWSRQGAVKLQQPIDGRMRIDDTDGRIRRGGG
jgi:hypothetical protein